MTNARLTTVVPTGTLTKTARIIEVFSSVQGEGLHVGELHLFVRFWDCNMQCHYCDTDYQGSFRELSEEEITVALGQFPGNHTAVSLTGGEPLLWRPFLESFLPRLKSKGEQIYLETNGTLPEALGKVVQWVDVVAMDVKPPSATGDKAYWREHEAFLRVALEAPHHPELFVKLVMTPQVTREDFDRVLSLIQRVDGTIPLVLQPVTPQREAERTLESGQLMEWFRLAQQELNHVRLIPQVHPKLGLP